MTGATFTTLLDIHKNTPTTNWKPKDRIPPNIEIVLELLEELPLEKRLLFIHNKLEERTVKHRE